jgi:hypothetical protein
MAARLVYAGTFFHPPPWSRQGDLMRYPRSILVCLSLALMSCAPPRQDAALSPIGAENTTPRTTTSEAPPPPPAPARTVSSATATSGVPTTNLHESPTVSWAPFILSTTLTLTSSAEISDLNWAPDGTALLYRTMQATYLLDLHTGRSQALNIPSRYYDWSPDGGQIGFINSATHTFDTYDLARGVATQGTDIRVITDRIDWMDWSADDTIFYATQKHMFVHEQKTADQQSTVRVKSSFSAPPGAAASSTSRVAWSPQGDAVVSMDRAAKTTLFFHGTELQKTLSARYELGLWSPDGALVVLTDINHTLDVYDRAGNLRERASAGNNIRPLAWIDSDHLIYTRNNAGSSPYNGYMFQRGSSEALAINEKLPDATAVQEAAASPTGTHLAYTTGHASGSQLIVRVLIAR